MEVMVLFVLLCLSLNNGYGTPQTSNVFRNQTWNEASNDSTCTMIGLNLTGEIEENFDSVTSSFVLDTNRTAWIGAYAKRVWINFEGCSFGKCKNNYSPMIPMSHEDPAKSCLRYCNYSRFVLAEDKCVCYKDVSGSNVGCIAMKCINTKYSYCGKGTAFSYNYIPLYCMCRFSMENNPSYISDEGDCLAVTFKPQRQFIAMNCSYTYSPICYDPNTTQVDRSGSSNNWLQSWSQCYDYNKQFAGRTTNVTGLHNGTYWVGTFAVTYKLWGRPRSANNSCVAVNIDRTEKHLTTVVLPCDTLLPVLCINTSISNNYTAITTECSSSCKHPSTTYPQQFSRIQDTSTAVLRSLVTKIYESVTSPVSKNTPTDSSDGSDDQTDILTEREHKSPVPLIVGSVVGSVVGVAIFVAVVSFLCRRRAFRKRSTETDISLPNEEDRISSINYRETNADTIQVNPGENIYANSDKCKTNGAEKPEESGYTEPHRYVSQGTTGSGVYINDAAMYQPELFAQQNPENHYCGLSLPSHDEHVYGHLK